MLWQEIEEINLDTINTVASYIRSYTGIKFFIQENAPGGGNVTYCIILEDGGTKQVLRTPSRDLTLTEVHIYLTGWLDAAKRLKSTKMGNCLPTPVPVDP
jgi:hypothetical protein